MSQEPPHAPLNINHSAPAQAPASSTTRGEASDGPANRHRRRLSPEKSALSAVATQRVPAGSSTASSDSLIAAHTQRRSHDVNRPPSALCMTISYDIQEDVVVVVVAGRGGSLGLSTLSPLHIILSSLCVLALCAPHARAAPRPGVGRVPRVQLACRLGSAGCCGDVCAQPRRRSCCRGRGACRCRSGAGAVHAQGSPKAQRQRDEREQLAREDERRPSPSVRALTLRLLRGAGATPTRYTPTTTTSRRAWRSLSRWWRTHRAVAPNFAL